MLPVFLNRPAYVQARVAPAQKLIGIRKKVLVAPGCWLALLFFAAGCQAPPQLPDPLAAGWNGAPVCEKLHEDRHKRVLRCTFPPGVGHERHYHAAHFGYIVSGGTMRVTDERGVRELDIGSGRGFASDGVRWHEALNVGETTVIVLIMESK